jgi:hypothetical protein
MLLQLLSLIVKMSKVRVGYFQFVPLWVWLNLQIRQLAGSNENGTKMMTHTDIIVFFK